jgi:hypothetical protein
MILLETQLSPTTKPFQCVKRSEDLQENCLTIVVKGAPKALPDRATADLRVPLHHFVTPSVCFYVVIIYIFIPCNCER